MLEPRKRTALDGKNYWCVFDTNTMKLSPLTCFGKYRTKKIASWLLIVIYKEIFFLDRRKV